MRIADKEIGRHVLPFVIAEMSGNHNQPLEHALEIVEAAAKACVKRHALKLLICTPDTIA